MIWKHLKDFCAQHNIELGYDGIRFSHIAETKKYFERRPKWYIFEYDKDHVKNNGCGMPPIDRYVWTNTGRKFIKAPIFFYRPPSLTSLNSYDLEEFLKKGKIPQGFFRRWNSEPIPIYNVNDLENAFTEIITYLETCKKLQDSADLKNYSIEFKNKTAEIEQLQNELESLKKKYRQSFCKLAGIQDDF